MPMPSVYNKRVGSYVVVSDDRLSVSWSETTINVGASVVIEAVSNGFMIIDRSGTKNTTYVETSYWDASRRLEKILTGHRDREEAFLATDYSAEDLDRLGYKASEE